MSPSIGGRGPHSGTYSMAIGEPGPMGPPGAPGATTPFATDAEAIAGDRTDVAMSPHATEVAYHTHHTEVSLADFGAVGDGTGDQTAAINAWAAQIRSLVTSAIRNGAVVKGVMPPGIYQCLGTVNLTAISASNCILNFNGAVIYSKAAGKPAVDALGSRFITFRDLCIRGDQTSMPTYGIQFGRHNTGSYGEHTFDCLDIAGYFSRTCLYHLGSEVNDYRHAQLFNLAAGGYCVIVDQGNYEHITSEFVTQTLPVDTRLVSSLGNCFFACDMRSETSGATILIRGNHGQLEFLSCYSAVISGDAHIETDRTSALRGAVFDMHCETFGALGLIKFDTTNQNVMVYGLKINDCNGSQYSNYIFNITSAANQLIVYDLELHAGAGPDAQLAGTGGGGDVSKIVITGNISWNKQGPLVFGDCIFTGRITTLPTAEVVVTPSAGSAYQIIRTGTVTTDRPHTFKGPVRSVGTVSSADMANYAELRGNAAGGGVSVAAGGTDPTIHAFIQPKGSTGRSWLGGANGAQKVAAHDTGVGFHASVPIAKPTVSGSRGANAALASLLTALANYGLITDSSSA